MFGLIQTVVYWITFKKEIIEINWNSTFLYLNENVLICILKLLMQLGLCVGEPSGVTAEVKFDLELVLMHVYDILQHNVRRWYENMPRHHT